AHAHRPFVGSGCRRPCGPDGWSAPLGRPPMCVPGWMRRSCDSFPQTRRHVRVFATYLPRGHGVTPRLGTSYPEVVQEGARLPPKGCPEAGVSRETPSAARHWVMPAPSAACRHGSGPLPDGRWQEPDSRSARRDQVASMGVRTWIESWPVYRQITGDDPTGRGNAAKSEWSEQLSPRTEDADRVVKSVCPYCAVGCGQNVYVKDEEVIQIEGDPDSPISRGRLCPKGSATLQLTTGDAREDKVLYRRPYGTDWEE